MTLQTQYKLIGHKNESFPELSTDDFHVITRQQAEEKPTYAKDIQFCTRLIHIRLEKIYLEQDGIIDLKALIKEVNKTYFFLRPKRIFDKAVKEKKHKGFFHLFLGMDKQRILSDYRLSLLYIFAMESWMAQRQSFVRRYLDLQEIPKEQRRLPLPDDLVPDNVYYKDYGLAYWGIIAWESLKRIHREIVILRKACQHMDNKNNVTLYINHDGEMIYGFNQTIMIKPGLTDKLTRLRGKTVAR